MHICFPIKTKLKSDSDSNKDADLITLKSFFAHFVKEISMTRYGNKKQSMTTFSPYEIYQYSDSMLKYVRKNALKNWKKKKNYSKQAVFFNKTAIDIRIHNSNIANDITDLNINE